MKIRTTLGVFRLLICPVKKAVNIGIETINCRGPQIWNLLPNCLKAAPSLEIFKRDIKTCKGEKYPSWICKIYIQQVGFI